MSRNAFDWPISIFYSWILKRRNWPITCMDTWISVTQCSQTLFVKLHHHFLQEIREIKVMKCPPNSSPQIFLTSQTSRVGWYITLFNPFMTLTSYSYHCFISLALFHCWLVAGLAWWWEHLPSTNVAGVRFPHPVSYVDWVFWFSNLLWEVFPSHKKPTFDLICE